MNADRAKYILQCAEKERDEFVHRMHNAAPNDAIRSTGAATLKAYEDKVKQARDMAIEFGAVVDVPKPVPVTPVTKQETLRLPKVAR